MFPADPDLKLVEQLFRHFGDEVMMHLEYLRTNGAVIPAGLQVVRYTTTERLNEIIRYHEEQGHLLANPHTYILEDGGRKQLMLNKSISKLRSIPTGFSNPGKMRGWLEREG